MKRTPLKRVSVKRAHQLIEYHALVDKLRALCNNRSELSGDKPDWTSNFQVEPHHLDGRENERLLDPFNIILITREEHTTQEDEIWGCHTKEYLLKLVRKIRLAQGFKGG